MITILEVAKARGISEDKGGLISGAEFDRVGLPMLGGCQSCGACIGPGDAYPSRTGYLQCGDCIYEEIGFETVDEFERFSS